MKMRKKHNTYGKVKLFVTLAGVILLIVFIVICAGKVKLSQNQKNIIGAWENSNSELVVTFQDTETLLIDSDMADIGLHSGNAFYSFSYTDTICVTQADTSVELQIDVNENQLIIYLMGQEYLTLHKQ